jgi:glycosyltransferase involved in cell wall biosynthesis
MNVADPQHLNRAETIPPADAFHLVYHGTMARRYGIDLILHALNQLHTELPALRLTMHGRGDYLETVQRLIQELGLEERVSLSADFVALPDLIRLIRSAHVGVVPYRRDVFTDGILPTKLMEYAALGIPAIVARTPAIMAYFDETMVEFFTAESVDELAECIRRLYHDRSRLEAMAHNVEQFNQRYNWTAQQAAYVGLVERLVGR